MALPTTYSTGTATINANETTVTGQGTTWLTSGLQAGDLFWAGGLTARISAVNSNTSLTLAFPWPGASRSAQVYEVRFTPDATRVLASARAVLDAIGGGNLASIGGLQTAADKLAYFAGAGVAALTDLTPHGRAVLGLTGGAGKYIRSTGAGTAAMSDIVGQTFQSGGKPTGSLVERGSSGNGEWVRLADGTQICWIIIDKTSEDWTQSYGGLFVPANPHVWTYPAAFSAQPAVVPGASRYGVGIAAGAMNRDVSTGFANLVPWICLSSPSGSGKSLHAIASGRWF